MARPIFRAVRARREALGLSQTLVAERAGVSRKTLVQIERCLAGDDGLPDRGISFASLVRVARVLGLEFGVRRKPGRARRPR